LQDREDVALRAKRLEQSAKEYSNSFFIHWLDDNRPCGFWLTRSEELGRRWQRKAEQTEPELSLRAVACSDIAILQTAVTTTLPGRQKEWLFV